ncbi:753_t:CDS:2, partial [Gigaspora rosea]
IDRIKNAINEDRDAINENRDAHSKGSCPNRQIARSNFNRSAYFKPLTSINFQNTPPGSDNEEEDYDEENNR